MGSAATAIDVGTVLADTYEVVGLLGRGGMGSVFAARHLRLPGKQVAIKVLHTEIADAESLARFRREAEIASRLGHPNIVDVHDFNALPDGTPYLILEYLAGESLAERIARGRLSIEETCAIVRQIGAALHAAHAEQIVHRDLKPQNVFLCPTEAAGHAALQVKVLDFGISKMRGSGTVQTQESALLGTPQYMAPEQATGNHAAVDASTDVFALGAIAYEMLSGQPAFGGTTIPEVVFKVVYQDPPPLGTLRPELPADLVEAVHRALAKDQSQRFATAAAFVHALTGTPLTTLRRAGGGPVPGAVATTLPSGDHRQAIATDATVGSGDHQRAIATDATVASGDHQRAIATDATVASGDHRQAVPARAIAATVASGDHRDAVGSREDRAAPVQASGASALAPAPRKGSRALALAAVAALVAAAVAITVLVMGGERTRPDGRDDPDNTTASAGTTETAPAVAAAAPAVAAAPPPDAAAGPPERVEPTNRPGATRPAGEEPSAQRDPSGDSDEGAGGDQPGPRDRKARTRPSPDGAEDDRADGAAAPEVAALLREAQAAIGRGDAGAALHAADRALRIRRTGAAFAAKAIAYCLRKDLGMVNATLQNVKNRRLRAQVTRACRRHGMEL